MRAPRGVGREHDEHKAMKPCPSKGRAELETSTSSRHTASGLSFQGAP